MCFRFLSRSYILQMTLILPPLNIIPLTLGILTESFRSSFAHPSPVLINAPTIPPIFQVPVFPSSYETPSIPKNVKTERLGVLTPSGNVTYGSLVKSLLHFPPRPDLLKITLGDWTTSYAWPWVVASSVMQTCMGHFSSLPHSCLLEIVLQKPLVV